jgi:hypothetical protein
MKAQIILLTVALPLAVVLPGCDTIADLGHAFDDVCIKGRLTADDAAALNAAHPKWADAPAAEGDRVLNGDCSDISKGVTQGTPIN